MSRCFRNMQVPANEVIKSCDLQINYTLPNFNGHLYHGTLFRSIFYNNTLQSQFVFNLPNITCCKSIAAYICCWFSLRGQRGQPNLRTYTDTLVREFQLLHGHHFQEFHLMFGPAKLNCALASTTD